VEQMLNETNYEKYVSEINESFAIVGLNVELELTEVTDQRITKRQEMFSLIFHGPKEPFLTQQTYPLENKNVGVSELFLVPIGETETGFKYEASFNLLLD
jgi:hypothetical protein